MGQGFRKERGGYVVFAETGGPGGRAWAYSGEENAEEIGRRGSAPVAAGGVP